VPGGDAPGPTRPAWVVEKPRHRGHERADDAADDVPEGQRSPQRIAGDSLHDVEREGRDPEADRKNDEHRVKGVLGYAGASFGHSQSSCVCFP
jgi:hypothetical protein